MSYTKGTLRNEREMRDNIYADLQVPTISNNGSTMMMSKFKCNQRDNYYASPFRNTEMSIPNSFQPCSLERAEI